MKGQDYPETKILPLIVVLQSHWQASPYLEEIEKVSIEGGVMLDDVADARLVSVQKIFNIVHEHDEVGLAHV